MCFSIDLNSNLQGLVKEYSAKIFEPSFLNMNNLLDKKCSDTLLLKKWDEQDKVFPNSFAPVIVQNKNEKNIFFMRYRIRPFASDKEVPTKFNMYNARIDSLTSKETWKKLFMRRHGIIVIRAFYEWVKDEKNLSSLVKFLPENHQDMVVPCLFDNWSSKDGGVKYSSFAIITNNAPSEILKKGHDRCPIFLKKENIDIWLNPKKYSQENVLAILENKKDTHYECLNIY